MKYLDYGNGTIGLAMALWVILPAASSIALAAPGHDHGDSMVHESYAVGEPVPGADPDLVITVTLTDLMSMEFQPDPDSIIAGQTVRFDVVNSGAVSHEFSIGNREEQEKHAEMMRSMPDMVHQDATTVTLKPGERKELTWRFLGKQTIIFACNIPGHYEAGMHKLVEMTHSMTPEDDHSSEAEGVDVNVNPDDSAQPVHSHGDHHH